MRRYDKREKRALQFLVVLAAIFTYAAADLAWEALVERPAAYEALRTRGVLANARVRCSRDDCTLTYTYAGRKHENRYHNDPDQFGPRPYALVLIDPEHPGTMYTADDLLRNTNAGFGVLAIFGLVATAVAAVLTFLAGRALRRFVPLTDLRPEPPTSAPASARAALR